MRKSEKEKKKFFCFRKLVVQAVCDTGPQWCQAIAGVRRGGVAAPRWKDHTFYEPQRFCFFVFLFFSSSSFLRSVQANIQANTYYISGKPDIRENSNSQTLQEVLGKMGAAAGAGDDMPELVSFEK